ncbi:hypothetical protein JZ751_026596 [Albula glossodonta]|uniref:Fibrosin n=1 Tax=Albula glossodonta TaxID=121402 RepID=A0A8T2PKM8_9TELE|nr:hypothetical protein JZ751_026596 [Albula glossodonta]
MSGIQPVLPPAGPFGSLQGAFQPKGTSPEMAARLGPVPHHLQPKDPRLTDTFRTSLRINNKPGKWCAMHVRVAWMILKHQEKVKLTQADPHKLDFRNNLLARIPGAGGLGGLGAQGSGLPSAHELARPASLFTASGGVHPAVSTFAPSPTPHSSFMTPSAHLDPFGRPPPFTSLGSLGTGAFGGLGSPSLGANSVFGHKESQGGAVGGLANPHNPWNRLHRTPPFPTTPSWAKGLERREDRVKDTEKKEVIHIKDEKDRDSLVYGRHPVRISPAAPSVKSCSTTPASQNNSLGQAVGSTGGPSEDEPLQARSRDRDRDTKPHSVAAPKAPLPVASSSALDRPCSSSSSAPPTPAPPVGLVPSPLDRYVRPQAHPPSTPPGEAFRPAQRDNSSSTPPSAPGSLHSGSLFKKSDHTTSAPVPKHAPSHPPTSLIPPVKVKEERKEELDPVPISLPPPAMPAHSYDRPSSRHHPAPPSAHLSLGHAPSVPLPPPTPHPHHTPLSLSLLDRSRATATIEAYLGVAGSSGGMVVGAAGDRFSSHPHAAPQGHSQPPHAFSWDPWRELAAQQQHREALAVRPDSHLALRTDPHLARLLQHQHVQRFLEAERAVAAVVAPHHPPATSISSSSSVRHEFGLMSHHQDRPPQVAGTIGSLLDEEQRTHILREDFERARCYGVHPHAHLSNPLLAGASHAAHLDQLHPTLLPHAHSHQPGASPRHPSLYSHLGPLHPHHVSNGLLAKTPSGLVGPLSVGAPPPLIPSVTPGRASTSPRNPRVGGPPELALYSAPKDRESR